MKGHLKAKLGVLTSLIGVSGSEQNVIRYCRDYLAPLADSIEILPIGSLIAKFDGKGPGPKMMVAAHADEIGLTITEITPSGFLRFEIFGGVQLRTLLASRILLNGRKGIIKGIVGLTPGHITPVEDRSKVPPIDQCYIDIGAANAQEVYEMGIEVGTTAVVESPLTEFNNSDLVTGRCIDDRAGCSFLLELAEEIKAGKIEFDGTLYITITVQEETGLLGAIHASDYIKPDCFIAVDTSPCGGTPDVPESKLPTKLGGGPIINVANLRSPTSKVFPNHSLSSFARAYAAKNDIPLQIVPSPGAGANDACAVSYVGSHCPTIAVVMPRRYSHSASELINLNDMVNEYRMIEGFVKNNGKISFNFLDE